MSAIYFKSRDDEAEVTGSERSYMDITTNKIGISLLEDIDVETIKSKIKKEGYYLSKEDANFKESFLLSMRVSNTDIIFEHEEMKLNGFTLMLNTALKSGGDAIKLMSRLHAQCEIHAYIKPENFKWLIKIIQKGLSDCIFRKDHGWEDVIRLLKETKTPVVTSFSVCDVFPTERIIGDRKRWKKLSYEEKWDLSFDDLIENNEHMMLEIKEDNWNDYYFGNNFSIYNFLN